MGLKGDNEIHTYLLDDFILFQYKNKSSVLYYRFHVQNKEIKGIET